MLRFGRLPFQETATLFITLRRTTPSRSAACFTEFQRLEASRKSCWKASAHLLSLPTALKRYVYTKNRESLLCLLPTSKVPRRRSPLNGFRIATGALHGLPTARS